MQNNPIEVDWRFALSVRSVNCRKEEPTHSLNIGSEALRCCARNAGASRDPPVAA